MIKLSENNFQQLISEIRIRCQERRCCATARGAAHHGADHLKHDELSSTKFICECDDSLFIVAQKNLEDIDDSVDGGDHCTVLQPPQPDRAVFRTGYNNLIVIGYCTAPNLNNEFEIKTFCQKHGWQERRLADKGQVGRQKIRGQVGRQEPRVWNKNRK